MFKKLNYKETLELAEKYHINALDLDIAVNVNEEFNDVNNEEFEEICSLVENAYLKSDSIAVWEIVMALKEMAYEYEDENGEKLDYSSVDKYKLLEKASYFA